MIDNCSTLCYRKRNLARVMLLVLLVSLLGLAILGLTCDDHPPNRGAPPPGGYQWQTMPTRPIHRSRSFHHICSPKKSTTSLRLAA